MKIDVRGLQAFTSVVDQGSFGKAAQALHLSQTALSHRLKSLESELGTRLIDRTTRTWSLTRPGERFYPRAKRLVEDLHESFRDMRESSEVGVGHITVACISMVASELVPRAIVKYSRRFPKTRVRILELRSPDVIDAIAQGRAEFGICIHGRRRPEIEVDAVRTEPYVLVCRDDHALSERKRVQWEDLKGQAVIAMVDTTNGIILNKIFMKLNFEVRTVHEAQRQTTALALVAAGLGITILPKLAVQSSMQPKLRAVSLSAPVITRDLVMLRRKGSALQEPVEAFYKLVRHAIKHG